MQTPIRVITLLSLIPLMLAAAGHAAGPAAGLEAEIRERTLKRAETDPATLVRDPVLVEAARSHSRAMHEDDRLAHELRGAGPDDRLARQHRRLFGLVSENVAVQKGWPRQADLAPRLVEGWMNSPGHRRNILAPYESFEVGCHGDAQVMYCTQLFVRAATRLTEDVAYLQAPGSRLHLILSPSAGSTAARVSVSPPDDATGDQGAPWKQGKATLRLPDEPGLYQLRLWLRQEDDPSRYRIIPGPYVCTVPGATPAVPAAEPRPCRPST